MKKITILTSVLALAACGGGHSVSDIVTDAATDMALQNFDVPQSTVSADAENYNKQITGMRSSVTNVAEMTAAVKNAIGEDALNDISNNYESIGLSMLRTSARNSGSKIFGDGSLSEEKSAFIFLEAGKKFLGWDNTKREEFFESQKDLVRHFGKFACGYDVSNYSKEDLFALIDRFKDKFNDFYDKYHYREYTLENVEFLMISTSGDHGDEGGQYKDLLTFKLGKNGQIEAVNHGVYNSITKEEDEGKRGIFTPNNDENNTFHVHQLANGEGTEFFGDGKFIMYGRDLGLKYSDFGEFSFNMHEKQADGTKVDSDDYREQFAGGYKDLRHDHPEANMTFSGRAIGSLQNDDNDMNINGAASLKFENGAETLAMNFSNPNEEGRPWYDVTIVRNKTTNVNSIAFKTNSDLNASIPNEFKFTDFDENGVRTPTYHLVDGYNGEGFGDNKVPGTGHGKIDLGYYGGPDGAVTEATGVTQYVESLGSEEAGEIRMGAAFGMIKDK